MSDNKLELPADKALAAKVIAAQSLENAARLDMGKIGEWFGSRHTASIYLAAMIIFLAGIALVIFACIEPSLRSDTEKALIALVTLAAGYIFGASKGGPH
jgi:hypothetical protein